MLSLCDHFSATVESAGCLKKQEAKRFHPEWSVRWIAGPLVGAGLAFFVLALVRSGVLVFATGAANPEEALTVTSEFAAISMGGLVGLSAKEVVVKLIKVTKSSLRIEEAKDGGAGKAEKEEVKSVDAVP